jgi:alpha-maltose-1-phosphate synthase
MAVSGAARAAEQISAALTRFCDVTIASMLNDSGTDVAAPDSHGPKRISTRSWLPPLVPWTKFGNRYRTLFYKSDLSEIVRRSGFNIVHIHNPMPALEMERVAVACRSRGIPYVVSTHGFNEIANGAEIHNFGIIRRSIWNRLVLQPVQNVVRNAAAIFALSPADIEIVRAMDYKGSNLPVIYNGVRMPPPANPAEDITVATRLGIPPRNPEQITCMFLANHTPNKGLPVLLEAFARTQHPYLLIIGGETRPEISYDQYIQSCRPGQQIIVTGRLADREVAALFRRADMFVFPTLADTFPLVVLEAMSYGKPVVASRVGGIPYQLTEECGVLVPPRDAAQLASVIETLAQQPERLVAMGRSARARVAAEFTWERAAEKAFSGYRAVLERRDARP